MTPVILATIRRLGSASGEACYVHGQHVLLGAWQDDWLALQTEFGPDIAKRRTFVLATWEEAFSLAQTEERHRLLGLTGRELHP